MGRSVNRKGWGGSFNSDGGGGIDPENAQAAITVSRTTDLNLDGTVQNPTFDTVIKSDATGNFSFTPGTDTITITKSGSYAFHVYCTTRNNSAFEFKLSLMNNGVEVPNIAARTEEGDDQVEVDEYQACIAIDAINLTAGTLKIIVQEISRSGTGTNQVVPGFVWSLRQNAGIAGQNGSDGQDSFSRDEFFIFLSSDTNGMNATTQKNAFKNSAQTSSKLSVLYDKGSIVDTANAKITPTEGTWEITYFVKAVGSVGSGDYVLARVHEDPDGANTQRFTGTQAFSGASLSNNGSCCSFQMKTDGTREFAFLVVSNDTSIDLIGADNPYACYAYGSRINTDST